MISGNGNENSDDADIINKTGEIRDNMKLVAWYPIKANSVAWLLRYTLSATMILMMQDTSHRGELCQYL